MPLFNRDRLATQLQPNADPHRTPQCGYWFGKLIFVFPARAAGDDWGRFRGEASAGAGSRRGPDRLRRPRLAAILSCECLAHAYQACVAWSGRRNKGLRPEGVAERQSGPQSEARFRPLRARIAHHRRERSEQRARLRFSATTPFANLSTCHRAKPLVWLASATTCLLSIICYLRPRQRRIFCYLLSVICYLLSVICYLRCASSASSVICYLRWRPASASAPLPARLCPRA